MTLQADQTYMYRALQLAALGRGFTRSNPMVGSVIVAPDGRIIGQGYHRRYGGPHAEVWALRSVAESDRPQLCHSTIYVTLEPCSHYGKTPPCAKLLYDTGFKRCVIGTVDPNPLVAGRGINMLHEHGIDVTCGILESECRKLNHIFFTRQLKGRPYILLKWAQSSDGYMDCRRESPNTPPASISTAVTRLAVHKLRGEFDAVMVGAGTVIADNPRLDVRNLPYSSPRAVVVDRRGKVPNDVRIFQRNDTIYISSKQRHDLPAHITWLQCGADASAEEYISLLQSIGITSVMVEGGPTLLQSFIDSGIYDEIRVEMSPIEFDVNGIATSSALLHSLVHKMTNAHISHLDGNTICTLRL